MSSVGPLLNSVFPHILNIASVTANSFSVEHVGWSLLRDLWYLTEHLGTVCAASVQVLVWQLQGGLCEERPELLHAAYAHSLSAPTDPVMDTTEPLNKAGGTSWRMGENTVHTVRSELKRDEKHPCSHQGQRRRKGRWCSRCGAEIPQQSVQENTVDQMWTMCSWRNLIWGRLTLKDWNFCREPTMEQGTSVRRKGL